MRYVKMLVRKLEQSLYRLKIISQKLEKKMLND